MVRVRPGLEAALCWSQAVHGAVQIVRLLVEGHADDIFEVQCLPRFP